MWNGGGGMTLTLTGAIDATQNNVQLSGDLDAQPGDLFRLDDELVEFGSYLAVDRQHAVSRSLCSFGRGVDGTTAASHTAGTELLGAVEAVESGTTSVIPAPFPSGGGGGGITMTVSDTDPGAIGAGNIWLQTDATGNNVSFQLYVRNATDDGWLTAGIADHVEDDIISHFWGVTDSTGERAGYVYLRADDGTGSGSARLQAYGAGEADLYVSGADGGVHLGQSVGAVGFYTGAGDPSVGIAAPLGSLYLRSDGQLWGKIASGDTDWSRIGTQAAFVANGSTVDQLRDALISSGLMAAS